MTSGPLPVGIASVYLDNGAPVRATSESVGQEAILSQENVNNNKGTPGARYYTPRHEPSREYLLLRISVGLAALASHWLISADLFIWMRECYPGIHN